MNRRDLGGPAVRVLNRGGFANADVLLVPSPGGLVIVKDYAQRSAWVRAWLAPILVRREAGALRKAQGIPGVPAWSEQIDERALAMEYVDGRPIRRRWHSGRLPDAFFSALEGILEALSERGLFHLDLRSPTNVLVTGTGAPTLVDFGSVTSLPVPRSIRSWLERRALRKLRRRVKGAPSPLLVGDEGGEPVGLSLSMRGVRWHRLEAGPILDPTPVVLLSDVGLGASVLADVLLGAAARGRRVIAFDLPGSGISGRGRGRRSPGRMGRELDEILHALRLSAVDLVGFGVGGIVARWMAAKRPGRVRTLVTIDAPIVQLDLFLSTCVSAARTDPRRLRSLLSDPAMSRLPERARDAAKPLVDWLITDELARPFRALPLRSRPSGSLAIDPRRLPLPGCPWLALFSDSDHPGLKEGDSLPGVRVALAEGGLAGTKVLWDELEKLQARDETQ